MRQVKNTLALLLAWNLGLNAATGQDAKALLGGIQAAQQQMDQELTGRLRLENGDRVPFRLRLQPGQITYQFDNPRETLVLNVSEPGAPLRDQVADQNLALNGGRLLQPVRGSDLTYEDLSLRFIYWDRATMEGEQPIRTVSCWIILVQPSTRDTQYGSVRLWVPKEGGGLLRAEGFDQKARLIKRFEVISGQKIGGRWWLKQVRVERFDPDTKKVVGRTYLEVNAPAAVS
ncbi:MAG TPA: outer membrane lipoprotein-sorting protein [Chthoniobacterales bacterium]